MNVGDEMKLSQKSAFTNFFGLLDKTLVGSTR